MKRCKSIDIAKYISSILVIIIHTEPLLDISGVADYFVSNSIARLAVPFFFISSSYFMFMNVKEYGESYIKKSIYSLLKQYLFWSILYIPIGYTWAIQNLQLPIYLFPLLIVIAFLYAGISYHLWYIPAYIFSVLSIHYGMKKIGTNKMFIIALLLFLFGSLETYYGFLPDSILKDIFTSYISIAHTTRNFLFFASIYVLGGYYFANTKIKRDQRIIRKIGISLVLFIIEVSLLFKSGYLDFNFILMSIPLIYYLFKWLLVLKIPTKWKTENLCRLSTYYYYTHIFFLFLVLLDSGSNSITRCLFVFLMTHTCAKLIILYKDYNKESIRYVFPPITNRIHLK